MTSAFAGVIGATVEEQKHLKGAASVISAMIHVLHVEGSLVKRSRSSSGERLNGRQIRLAGCCGVVASLLSWSALPPI